MSYANGDEKDNQVLSDSPDSMSLADDDELNGKELHEDASFNGRAEVEEHSDEGAESGGDDIDEHTDEDMAADEQEEEEEEEEDDEEPALKYERLGGSVHDLLQKDSASALTYSNQRLVRPVVCLWVDSDHS